MPTATKDYRLDWTAKVTLYRDRHDAQRGADAEAQKRGERIVYEPLDASEEVRQAAWAVIVWTPPKKRRR